MLLECFLTLYRYVRMMRRASDSIFDPLIANNVYFLPNEMPSKISNLGDHISLRNMMMCHKDRHPLLLGCPIIFFRHIRMIGEASSSQFNPVMVNTVSFLPNEMLKFQAKFAITGTTSA